MAETLVSVEETNQIVKENNPSPSESLFSPPTSEEISRRLAAIRAFDAHTEGLKAPDLNLTGERDSVFGYVEREDPQS